MDQRDGEDSETENSTVEIEIQGWQSFFEELGRFFQSSGRSFHSCNVSYANYVVECLETCIITLNALKESLENASASNMNETLISYKDQMQELLSICRSLSVCWEEKTQSIDMTSSMNMYSYNVPIENPSSRVRGRPRFDISKEQLLYLSSLSFSWIDISHMLGVFRMTLYRRRMEYGLDRDPNVFVSDVQLHTILREIKAGNPELGETMVMGRIRGMGYRVTRERLRQAIRRIDPLHTTLRWRGGLSSRRPYSVPGPNSLWHIDGHHKLVRWNFVTHAGIDGYSRMIVYLKCSTNNQASTVYKSFLDAVHQYGLPSRVRFDQGRENILVARHMIEHRGSERNSMITGSSVHNQRSNQAILQVVLFS